MAGAVVLPNAVPPTWRTTHTSSTRPVRLRCLNNSPVQVSLAWVNYQHQNQEYARLSPGDETSQATYDTHLWKILLDGECLGAYMGPSVELEVTPELRVIAEPPSSIERWCKPEWGSYRQRHVSCGIPIWAWDLVGDDAVLAAGHIITRMLSCTPKVVLKRMVKCGCKVAIIARDQVTTDIPEHHFMKKRSQFSSRRDLDTTCRGLGATPAVPTTSCGEENLTMVEDRSYCKENILIHEFGHAIMNCGLDDLHRQGICQLYIKAKQSGLYSPDIYMMENEEEYWAEACQSWFNATIRTDVNNGINTREKLEAHDPGLATLLRYAFGDNPWRYTDDSPAPLGSTSSMARKGSVTTGGQKEAGGLPPQHLSPHQQGDEVPGKHARWWRGLFKCCGGRWDDTGY